MDRKDFLKARIMEGMGKKSGTKPMSDKEKSLAALAHPKDKITHKDVLVGRGVLKKEEVESVEEMNKSGYSPGWMLKADPKLGKKVKDKIALAKLRQKAYGDPSAGKSVTTKEEVELDEMDKSQPSSSRGAEGLPLGKKAEPIKTDKAKQDALKALQKQYKKVKEEVEQVDEGNKENKAKKNTYVANIIKKKLSSQVLPSLKFGRRELKKEEVEQIDELKKGTLMSYVGKAREKNIKDSAKNRLAGTETSLADIDKQQAKVSKRSKGIQRAYTRLNKEEVEQMGEAFINGREYASHGLMHPDHAKWQSHRVGVHTDFYAHGTGDKINGQVMKNDGKEVHIKATKSSGGKLHKFKVQSELPKGKKKQKDDLDDTYNQQGTDDKGRNRKDREDDDDGTYHQRGTHDKGNKKQGVAEADKHYSK